MNATRAENIVKYRADNGPFKSREEVKKVKAIGTKTFEQCAGFIRIDFATSNLKGKQNILDSTWVHPESYEIAKKIINNFQLSLNEIGTESFIARIKQAQGENATIGELAKQFRVPEARVRVYYWRKKTFFSVFDSIFANICFQSTYFDCFYSRSKVSLTLLPENYKRTIVMMLTFGHFLSKVF